MRAVIPDRLPDSWSTDSVYAQPLEQLVVRRLTEASAQGRRVVFIADDGSRVLCRTYQGRVGVEVVTGDHWIHPLALGDPLWRLDHYHAVRQQAPTWRTDLRHLPARWREPSKYQWEVRWVVPIVVSLIDDAERAPRGTQFCDPILLRGV